MSLTLAGLVTFAVICASPGPACIGMIATAMASGRMPALAFGIGLTAALGIWGALAALGLGTLLALMPAAQIALKLGSAALLFWLAWGAARSAMTPEGAVRPRPMTVRRALLAGFGLNMMNPKAILVWTATLGMGLPAAASPGSTGLLVAACILAALAIYAAYALAFSAGPLRRAYAGLRRWVDAATAAVLGGSGAALLFWRARPD